MKKDNKATTRKGSAKKAAAKTKERPKIHYEILHALDTVKETDGNREALTDLCDTLAMWARYMMEISPTAAANIYRACSDALDENRATLYNFPYLPHDPRERQAQIWHTRVVEKYDAAFGIESPFKNWPTWVREREEGLLQMQSQLAKVAARAYAE
jgi:hypothetical protein